MWSTPATTNTERAVIIGYDIYHRTIPSSGKYTIKLPQDLKKLQSKAEQRAGRAVTGFHSNRIPNNLRLAYGGNGRVPKCSFL